MAGATQHFRIVLIRHDDQEVLRFHNRDPLLKTQDLRLKLKWLPVLKGGDVKAEIHYSTIYNVVAKRTDDGSIATAFVLSMGYLSEQNQLDLSILHGDGANTVAQKGGEVIEFLVSKLIFHR